MQLMNHNSTQRFALSCGGSTIPRRLPTRHYGHVVCPNYQVVIMVDFVKNCHEFLFKELKS